MLYTESMKKREDFRHTYRKGKVISNRLLVMYVIKAENEENRLGISVSKKVGNSVVRHRVTRLIRESYRLNETQIERGVDLVVIARKKAGNATYAEVESALIQLARLHGIINERGKGEH